MFSSAEQQTAFRQKVFKEINVSGTGKIPFDEWMDWAYTHICRKGQELQVQYAETKMTTSADDFKLFITSASKSRHCPEFKELYHFLKSCFDKADRKCEGLIKLEQFDEMCELAGAAPRKFGFAPPSSQTYANDQARIRARGKMFDDIAAKNKRGFKDKLSFNAWLEWAYSHICEKAMRLDPSLSGVAPSIGDMRHASYGAQNRVKLSSVMRGITVAHATENRGTFVKFIKKATASKESAEYAELRHYLMDCFVECDTDFDGLIKDDTFDDMVERAGALPRKWGFA